MAAETPWVCDTWFDTEAERQAHRDEFVCYDEATERRAKVSKTAVLITGPRWWGDVSLDRGRAPISLEEVVVAEARRAEAADERRAIEMAIGDLPEGTLVIHGAARGADTMASQEAQRRKLPVASVPYFGHLGGRGGPERNEAMIAMLQGLAAAGWKVKVVGFIPEHAVQQTGTREVESISTGTVGCLQLATDASLFVKTVFPAPEPEPEPEIAEDETDKIESEPEPKPQF